MRPSLAISESFHEIFGREGDVFRAPGRVNLIGEHTDYNGGFVMPAAIGFFTWAAMAPRNDRKLRLRSQNFNEERIFDLDNAPGRGDGNWSDYPLGVAVTLERAGYRLRGADLLLEGNVPIGAGLSSSASVEVATASALLAASSIDLDKTEIALLCQRAENEFVGMRCGIMDQFIACRGRAGHALILDCRSLDWKAAPLQDGVKLVVCNTMVKHQLAGSEYNLRREECEAGVRYLRQFLLGIQTLRDVSLDDLVRFGSGMPGVVFRRCRHVITENTRVEDAAAALTAGNLDAFGVLMAGSHNSLRYDYEVSCAELDLMVELAVAQPDVYGARMTGGGFGGCTINLVKADAVESFQLTVAEGYEQVTGRKPDIYVTTAVDGAGRVDTDEL
jgi:galactokinase